MAGRCGSILRSLKSSAKASSIGASTSSLNYAEAHCIQAHRSSLTISTSARTMEQLSYNNLLMSMPGRSTLGGSNLSFTWNTAQNLAFGNFLAQQKRTFIQMRTVLKAVDNSGAKKVMCIQAMKGKKGARLGDTIVVSVREALPNGKAKKGNVYRAVVVRAAMQRGRCDGSEVKFDDNACVLLDGKTGQPLGTRVFGPVPHELRKKKHVKILTLAGHIA